MADEIPWALACVFRPGYHAQLCTRDAGVLLVVVVVIVLSVSVRQPSGDRYL